MTIEEIRNKLNEYKQQQKKIFATSSFQTSSTVLLHIISIIDNTIPIYFINTGYHFPETIKFKNKLTALFNLNVINLNPFLPKSQQKDNIGKLLFTSDPDYCCYLNKVQPLENLLGDYDIWINGVRADQTDNRSHLHTFESAQHNVIRFHPLLNWTSKQVYEYIKQNNLPYHPLEQNGYFSVGCEPCTAKSTNANRTGRWFGSNKTECGLNNELIIK